MGNVLAHGTFCKRNGHIFRTDTYLQWGDSDEIIGACVMCNPGSAKLKNIGDIEGKLVDSGNPLGGEMNIDPTLDQIRKIVESANEGRDIRGRVLIYNLFTLVNTNMAEAVKGVDDIVIDSEDLLFKDLKDFMLTYDKIPWILIGWGCEKKVRIREEKFKWMNVIENVDIKYFGIRGKIWPDFLHPLPPNINKQKEYVETVSEKYKRYLEILVPSYVDSVKVILNREKLDYIPRIDFDLPKDVIVSNGHIIVANYIDEFGDGIGFYYEDKDIPVAWIYEPDGPVYIETYERNGRRLCVVRSKYTINIDVDRLLS